MSDVATAPVLDLAPPGPAGWPVIGSLLDFLGEPHEFMLQIRKEYGPLVSWSILGETYWLVSDPDIIQEMLIGQHRLMHKDAIYNRMTLLGKGLVTSEDELWKKQRKIASKPFARKVVDTYAAHMRRIVDPWVARCSGVRDVYTDMNRLTEQIVLEVLFGVPADATTDQVGPAITTWMEHFQAEDSSLLRIVPEWVPTPGRRRARIAEETINEIVYGIIEQKRKSTELGEDVLSRLIHAAEGGMSDQQLRDEAVTMFLAGHETTALALTYSLRQLALHPEWQEKARVEVRAALPDGPRTASEAMALPVLTAILKESMRLHPPAWAIGRENIQETTLGGRFVPLKTQLIISQYVMHRDPKWFDAPESWNPQRWLDGLEETLPRFVYMPFGGGPRVCIGNHFAMLEALIALAVLLRDHQVEPVGDMSLKLVPSVTLRPAHPVELRWSEV